MKDYRGRSITKRRFQEIFGVRRKGGGRRCDNVNHEEAARSGLSGLSLDTKSDRICQKSVTRPTMRAGFSVRDFTHTLKSDRIERGTARGAEAEGSPKLAHRYVSRWVPAAYI